MLARPSTVVGGRREETQNSKGSVVGLPAADERENTHFSAFANPIKLMQGTLKCSQIEGIRGLILVPPFSQVTTVYPLTLARAMTKGSA